MDRTTIRTVVLAVLAILALAVAAATLDTTVATSGSASGFGDGDRPGFGAGSEGSGIWSAGGLFGHLFIPICVPWLAEPPALLAIAAVVLLGNLLVARRTESLLPGAALTISLGAPVFVVWAALVACRSPGPLGLTRRVGDGAIVPPPLLAGGGGGLLGSGGDGIPASLTLLSVLVVLALGGVLVVFALSSGEDDRSDERERAEPSPVDVAAIGRAAGEAADRIERDADVDNEVYRAWAAMTDHLDVANPRSSTPTEFATAAVDAGMDRDDVDELTRLFEVVRYGGVVPTEEREARAVEALRRIESAYADDGAES